MKTLVTFLVSTLFTVSGFAQYGQQRQYNQYGQSVTINFNGNGNGNNGYQVIMDGTTYSSRTNNNGTWNRNTSNRYGDDDITINNVQPGQHSIQVYRVRTNSRPNNRGYGNTASPVYSSTFNLRQGYDATLDIKGNGEVRFSEKRSNNNRDKRDRDRDRDRRDDNDGWRNGGNNNGGYNNGGYNNGGYRTPMADYQFSQLYQDVKSKWFQSNKITSVRDAFSNTATYFSTYQITQLLQLITSESSRLELAKLSYRVVADPANFTQVYSLFSNQNNRNELDRYVRSYRYN
jgi:hypothetical protein